MCAGRGAYCPTRTANLVTARAVQAPGHNLTCFLAAALETDDGIRAGYEDAVLAPLGRGGELPRIVAVVTQAAFPEQRSYPDMLLTLADGRRVACEHKLEAPETILPDAAEGEPSAQLERYLRLPDVAALAYFRATLRPPADHVLAHERYLRPAGAAHFLWADLYHALLRAGQPTGRWLREGFERLGFVPGVPHVGTLVSGDQEEGHRAQANFGKLWALTRDELSRTWRSERGTSATLYLTPKGPSPVEYVFLYPLLQGGTLLRTRLKFAADAQASTVDAVKQQMERLAPALPVRPEVTVSRLADGTTVVDLVVALALVLGDAADADAQAVRLLAQVRPVAEALEAMGAPAG